MLWIWTRRPQEWHLVTRQGYVTSVCPFTPNLDHLAKGLSVRFLCNKGTNFSFVINIYFPGYTWDFRCAVSLYTYFSKHWQILTAVIITTAFLWWFWISLIPSLFTNWNSSCPFSPIYVIFLHHRFSHLFFYSSVSINVDSRIFYPLAYNPTPSWFIFLFKFFLLWS